MSIVDVERSAAAKYKLQVIDCDIHPAMTSWKEVHPYLEQRWIEHLTVYGSHLRHAFSEALSHPRMSPDAARVDAYPEEGGPPGSSLDLMRKQHLDPNGVEIGMLIDMLEKFGLNAIAQVDLQERIHHNQPLEALSKMSFAIIQAVIRKLESRYGQSILENVNKTMKLIRYEEESFRLDVEEIAERDRPPMIELPEYLERLRLFANP